MEELPGEILELIAEVHGASLPCVSSGIGAKLSAKEFVKKKRECISEKRAAAKARIASLAPGAPQAMGNFEKFYAADLLVDGAPEPPTLHSIEWITDVAYEMLDLFEKKGGPVLHAAMTRRRLYWIGEKVEVFGPTLGRENAEAIKLFEA